MESGTDVTHNFDFYSSTYAGISSNCTIAETGSCSIEAKNSPANTNNLVNTPPGSLNGTAARISFYVYFTNLNGGSNLIELYDGGPMWRCSRSVSELKWISIVELQMQAQATVHKVLLYQ